MMPGIGATLDFRQKARGNDEIMDSRPTDCGNDGVGRPRSDGKGRPRNDLDPSSPSAVIGDPGPQAMRTNQH